MRSQAGSRIVVTPIGGRRLAASDLLLCRLAQYPVEDRANERQQQDGDDPTRLGLTREGATDYCRTPRDRHAIAKAPLSA